MTHIWIEKAKVEQALKALEWARSMHDVMLLSDPPQSAWRYHNVDMKLRDSANVLRQAIATEESSATQEPVAILNHAHGVHVFRSVNLNGLPDGEYAVYTHPQPKAEQEPKREPLTDEQLRKVKHHMVDGAYHYSFMQGARYAERYHGIKGEA